MMDMKHRSDEREIMDDFTLEGAYLRSNLDILASINKWLGGNQITLQGIRKLLKESPKNRKYVVVDMGCGNGDMLRRISKLSQQIGVEFDLIGIDANLDTIRYAQELSKAYADIRYVQMNVFSDEFNAMKYDIALSTLFLHHLSDDEIIDKLNRLKQSARIGIIVNDLERNRMAYFLFNIISFFINNKIVRNDGLVSIRRGFKKRELLAFSDRLQLESQVCWKWAFRYQWIVKTNV